MAFDNRPIGVFDSGLGGLTIVRQIRKKLPHESVVYFGDIARLPYGIKSTEQIKEFSFQNAKFLKQQNVKAIVVGCNSSSSAAYRALKKKHRIPVLDVIEPACKQAVERSKSKRIGVIATHATVDSGAYARTIKGFDSNAKVFAQGCPLLVPFVEEGIVSGKMIREILRGYLAPLLKKRIDVLILGCTHYPLLKSAIQQVVGKKTVLVDSAKPTAQQLSALFPSPQKKIKGSLKVFVSDKPRNFLRVGEKFLGEKIKSVKVVRS